LFSAYALSEKANSGEEISTRWRCFEKINHLRDSWLVLRNDGLETIFQTYNAILEFLLCI